MSLQYINKNITKDANATFTDVRAEINRLLDVVYANYNEAMEILMAYDEGKYDQIFYREKIINNLNKQISAFIIDSLSLSMDEETSSNFVSYLRISRNLERVGDHSKNIADVAKLKHEEKLDFTNIAYEDLYIINDSLGEMLNAMVEDLSRSERVNIASFQYRDIQKKIDKFRYDHMLRMRGRSCNPESGLVYEKTLTALERVSSYLSNAAKLSI